MTTAPARHRAAVTARRLADGRLDDLLQAAQSRLHDIPARHRPLLALGGGLLLFLLAFMVVFGLPGSTLGMFLTAYGLFALVGGAVVVAVAYEHQHRQRAKRMAASRRRRRTITLPD